MYCEELEGRSVLVKKAKPLPVLIIVRSCPPAQWDYKGHRFPSAKLPKAPAESAVSGATALFLPVPEAGGTRQYFSRARNPRLLMSGSCKRPWPCPLQRREREREARAWKAEKPRHHHADTCCKFPSRFGVVDVRAILTVFLTPDSHASLPLLASQGWLFSGGPEPVSFDKQYLRLAVPGQPVGQDPAITPPCPGEGWSKPGRTNISEKPFTAF